MRTRSLHLLYEKKERMGGRIPGRKDVAGEEDSFKHSVPELFW